MELVRTKITKDTFDHLIRGGVLRVYIGDNEYHEPVIEELGYHEMAILLSKALIIFLSNLKSITNGH